MKISPASCALLLLADSLSPPWATDKILAFPEDKFLRLGPYISRHHWQAEGSINVYRVIGTRHPDYQGMTWREFLEQGKRMATINRPLWEKNPGYYEGTQVKPPLMSYITLDGMDWYIDDDGNHRTCVARYHFEKDHRSGWLHGVGLSDWRFDTDFAKALEVASTIAEDRQIDVQLKHQARIVKRLDGPTWKIDYYENKAILDIGSTSTLPPEFTAGATLDTAALERLSAAMQTPAWRRWFKT